MQVQGGQGGAAGSLANVEYIDRIGQFTIAAGATLFNGSTLCRDLTQLSGAKSTSSGGAPANYAATTGGGQCDVVVYPNNANAGDPYGVYQGPNIVNPSATATLTVYVKCRWKGYGTVIVAVNSANISVAVNSGLICSVIGGQYPVAGTRAIGISVGQATAFVSALAGNALISAPAAVIVGIANQPTTVAINADISVF